ncbi:tetratricopeptide repeat protein [Terasakiella sp.]|uniref:tetratricopeptide repeat protein n=1 Tax=Terasakiella sp. TaxID=2034861 RepID=UPI003AA87CDB
MTIFRLALTVASLTILSACADLPLPEPLTETVAGQSTKAERLKEISERMRWMAPEKAWHYNCLFLKPIAQLNQDEQMLALVNSKILSIAHFEEKRLAYRSAGSLYRRAADQGIAYANAKLGNILIAGKGVSPNPIGGTQLVQQSAQLDCAFGQYRYGELLSKGIGVKANFIDAWAWLELARRQGYEDEQKLQNKVEGFLGPVQLQLANQKADTLRQQLDIFNKGPQSQQLIQCVTPRSKEPFITRMRACHAMSGTHVGSLIDYRQNK